KNAAGQRDPEMRSSKKGNQWHFGMKAHIGVDARSGLVHTAGVTSGSVHDATAHQRARNRRFGKGFAKVGHVFRGMKCQFGYRKVRYRGLDKNAAQVFSLLALANLYLARRTIACA